MPCRQIGQTEPRDNETADAFRYFFRQHRANYNGCFWDGTLIAGMRNGVSKIEGRAVISLYFHMECNRIIGGRSEERAWMASENGDEAIRAIFFDGK